MFIPLKDVILRSARRLRSGNEANLIIIKEAWAKTTQALNLKTNIEPTFFRGGKLTIVCSSLNEAAHFRLLEREVTSSLNSIIGKQMIKKTVFSCKPHP